MSEITVSVTQSDIAANVTSPNISATVTSADIAANVTTAEVTANVEAANVTVNITGGGSPHIIQDEGVAETQRANLNFVGAGVSVSDDSVNNATVVTIAGGGGSGASTIDIIAGEDLAVRDLVYIAADGLAYKADASDEAKEAVAIVQDIVLTGDTGTAYLGALLVSGFTGLTANRVYFLNTTPGGITLTPPSVGGGIVQQVAKSTGTTGVIFNPQDSIYIGGTIAPTDDYRITEAGDSRITESGDSRILETVATFYRLTEGGDIRITETGDIRVQE